MDHSCVTYYEAGQALRRLVDAGYATLDIEPTAPIPAPVIAVPTSAGYGAALEGVTALLAMLSSCAAGITVVGIDNGFGAASAVLRLLK